MQFVIVGLDGDEPEALNRRMAARDSHIAYSEMAAKTGEQIIAAATLNQEGNMNGSVMIVEFEDLDAVKAWLDKEAYVTGKVWKNVQIMPCKISPVFGHLIKKS